MFECLSVEQNGGVGIIRFDRPEQLNAMNRKLMNEIVDACHDMNANDSISVVVITGNGRAFMAGADIKEYAAQTDEDFVSFQKKGIEMYQAMEQSTKPYIAMVNGFALGGGFEIACACDLIIASEDAQMGLPEVHLGLIPGGGGTQRLIQKVGINRVKQMLYFGSQFRAREMMSWGIVNECFPRETLEENCISLAEKLAKKSTEAMAELKKLVNASVGIESFEQRIEKEGYSVARLFQSETAQARIAAFIKKNEE